MTVLSSWYEYLNPERRYLHWNLARAFHLLQREKDGRLQWCECWRQKTSLNCMHLVSQTTTRRHHKVMAISGYFPVHHQRRSNISISTQTPGHACLHALRETLHDITKHQAISSADFWTLEKSRSTSSVHTVWRHRCNPPPPPPVTYVTFVFAMYTVDQNTRHWLWGLLKRFVR